MICPNCAENDKTTILMLYDSRPNDKKRPTSRIRKYKCPVCKARYANDEDMSRAELIRDPEPVNCSSQPILAN